MRTTQYVACTVLTVAVAACSSMGNPFGRLKPDYSEVPLAALREVADEIEQAVHYGNRNARIADRGGIIVNTEAIRQAIRSRAARSELIEAFRDTGHACEKPNGRLYILRTRAYKKYGTRKDRARKALLVLSENNDRWTLYEGIVKASNLPPGALSAVEETFFKARLAYLDPEHVCEQE